jgi:nucleoid-associated protein YgaU
MGLLSFMKDAGEKLFGRGKAQAAQAAAQANATAENLAAANEAAGQAIVDYIRSMKLDADGLAVDVDAATGTVTVSGEAPDEATREKIVLCCGNVHSVSNVNDNMSVKIPADASTWHTVVSGDTLSAIALKAYGNAGKYPVIFEANKPMLTHPDKIYPGQVLRIPPQ